MKPIAKKDAKFTPYSIKLINLHEKMYKVAGILSGWLKKV